MVGSEIGMDLGIETKAGQVGKLEPDYARPESQPEEFGPFSFCQSTFILLSTYCKQGAVVNDGNSKLGVIPALQASKETVIAGCDKCFKRGENMMPWKQRQKLKGDSLSKLRKS